MRRLRDDGGRGGRRGDGSGNVRLERAAGGVVLEPDVVDGGESGLAASGHDLDLGINLVGWISN